MNLPTRGIRTAEHRYGDTVFGIHLSRFGASWLNSGGNIDDSVGFIVWMMNIPFKNEDGSISFISQDDAEDAYWVMATGKLELETSAKAFLAEHEKTKRGFCIIKEFK